MTTLAGKYGMAEQAPVPFHSPVLMRWVVTTKMYHPSYRQFMIVLIHLRPHPEWDPPVVSIPGSTHAISSLTLDPDFPWDVDKPATYLYPINFEAQFKARDDDQAVAVLEDCVHRVLEGELSPESGNAPMAVTKDWTKAINKAVYWRSRRG